MSFYITLPSNSSAKIYPHNVQSEYTTLLPENIHLINGPYEVALAELDYTPSFELNCGTFEINNFFENSYEIVKNDKFKFNFQVQNGCTSKEFCELINESLQTHVIMNDIIQRDHMFLSKHDQNMIEQINKNNELKFSKFEENDIVSFDVYAHSNDKDFYIFSGLSNPFKSIFEGCGGKFSNFITDQDQTLPLFLPGQPHYSWKFTVDNIKKLTEKFDLYLIQQFSEDLTLHEINEKRSIVHMQSMHNLNKKRFHILKRKVLSQTTILTKFDTLNAHYVDTNLNFIFDQLKKTVKVKSKAQVSILDGPLIDLIKIHNSLESNILPNDKDLIFPQKLDFIKYACIYCDLIENQYIGDVFAPIIKIFPIRSNVDMTVQSFIDNMHYVLVKKSNINTINISIRDLQGNKILFNDLTSIVIIKLHFRKIQ